jgi:predicted RNase H-like HicB family nuclease
MKIEQKMARSVAEYLTLPYTFKVRRDDRDEVFVARVEELPGCSAHGAAVEEAIANLRDSMKEWIEDSLEAGDPVPLPAEEVGLPSGKWLQRVPRSLHLKLIRLAKDEGVSLNQLVNTALAEAVGRKSSEIIRWHSAEAGAAYANQGLVTTKFPIMTAKYDIKNKIGLPISLPMISDSYVGVLGLASPQQELKIGQERRAHAKTEEKIFTYRS